MEQVIVDYIFEAKKHGLSDYEIKQNLLGAGWDAEIIEKSFVFFKIQNVKKTDEVLEQARDLEPSIKNSVSLETDTTINSSVKKALNIKRVGFVFLVCSFLGIILLSGFYLTKKNPKILALNFLNKIFSSSYTANYDISYSTNSQAQNLKVSLLGTTNVDSSSYKSESDGQIQVKLNENNFSNDLNHIKVGDELYFKIGSNPILNILTEELNSGNEIEWLKLDLNTIKQNLNIKFKQNINEQELKNIITVEKFVGFKKINNQVTVHFLNSINKKELNNFIEQNVEYSKQDAKSVLAIEFLLQLIEKAQIKNFESWITIPNLKLNKISFEISVPNLNFDTQTLFVNPADIKRVSDIKQIQTALTNYNLKFGGYPEADSGKPVNLSPQFISEIPKAPSPASGNCTDYFNGYWYKPMGEKKIVKNIPVYSSYQLTFCIGFDTENYKAGIGKLTPEGVFSNIDCTAKAELCKQEVNKNEVKDWAVKIAQELDYSANLKFDFKFSNFGSAFVINPPAKSLDVLESLNMATEKAYNAKILSDIRQLTTALEKYLNDFGRYPENINFLVPKYLELIPFPQKSLNSSTCPAELNTYQYKRTNLKQFEINFCLTKETGGYKEGLRTVTNSGIQ